MSKPWLIVAAIEQEIQGLRRMLSSPCPEKISKGKAWSGLLQDRPVLLVRAGVGPKKMRKVMATLLADRDFRGVISIGYAGALYSNYKVGDIVIPQSLKTIPPLPAFQACPDQRLFETAWEIARSRPQVCHADQMITSNRVIALSQEKYQLGIDHQAGSVEMESTIIAESAQKGKIPFLAIRVILDEAAFSLPDTLQLSHWWRQKKWRRLFLSFLRQPISLVQLIKLAYHTRLASRELTDFINAYVVSIDL